MKLELKTLFKKNKKLHYYPNQHEPLDERECWSLDKK